MPFFSLEVAGSKFPDNRKTGVRALLVSALLDRDLILNAFLAASSSFEHQLPSTVFLAMMKLLKPVRSR